MSVATAPTRRWKKPPLIKDRRLRWAIGLGIAFYLALAFATTEVNWLRVYDGLPRGSKIPRRVLPARFYIAMVGNR